MAFVREAELREKLRAPLLTDGDERATICLQMGIVIAEPREVHGTVPAGVNAAHTKAGVT